MQQKTLFELGMSGCDIVDVASRIAMAPADVGTGVGRTPSDEAARKAGHGF